VKPEDEAWLERIDEWTVTVSVTWLVEFAAVVTRRCPI